VANNKSLIVIVRHLLKSKNVGHFHFKTFNINVLKRLWSDERMEKEIDRWIER